MKFLVLTSARGVSDSAVDQIMRDVGMGGCRVKRWAEHWVDIEYRYEPPRIKEARANFEELNVDANIVSAEGREKRLLIADMDSTMIGVECIDELADFAGVKAQVVEVTDAAMRGEIDFEEALRSRVSLLRGLPVEAMQQCYDERVSLNPGARQLVRTMNARGAITALVSGGFTFFTERVAGEAGFLHHQANVLLHDSGLLTGDVASPVLGRAAKRSALGQYVETGNISVEDVLAVGDGANDSDMVTVAGLGVAYHAKPALRRVADAVIDHSDLTALLALQGIDPADWA